MDKNKLIFEMCKSLEAMDKIFWDLSRARVSEVSESNIQILKEQKVLERPLAYEFYHQFRLRWDKDKQLQRFVIQAEVNKSYQHIPYLKKMPDFLLHQVGNLNLSANEAVVEFKMAICLSELEADMIKLEAFRIILQYSHLVEILIGNSKELENANSKMQDIADSSIVGNPTSIDVISFNIDDKKVERCDTYHFRSVYSLAFEAARIHYDIK